MGRPNTERPKKKGEPETDEVKCSGCGTFLGFADDIMYAIGTTEVMCHWCEEKVTKEMTEPELDLENYKDIPVRVTLNTNSKDNKLGDTRLALSRIKETEATVEPELTIRYDPRPSSALKYESKDIVEFAPPEPETNICPLCNDIIPDDTLRSPNILCEKCHRPIACPRCKEEVLEPVGITECPWCHSDTDSAEKIKHALRVREAKREYEKELEVPLDFPDYGEGTPYSSMTHAMAGVKDQEQDQYPYRDGPDVMKQKGGWGAPFDIKKPTIASIAKEQEKIADIMLNEINNEVEQTKEEAQRGTGRSTQRRLSVMNHLVNRLTGFFYEKRKVLLIVDTQAHARETKRSFELLRLKNLSGKYVLADIMKNVDIRTFRDLGRGHRGYTLIVIDLVAPMRKKEAKALRMDISIHGCPIIGGESIVEMEEEEKPDPDPTKYNVAERIGFRPKIILDGEEIPISNVKYTVDHSDQQPIYQVGDRQAVGIARGPAKIKGEFEGVLLKEVVGLPSNEEGTFGHTIEPVKPVRSRTEKPPKSARAYLKEPKSKRRDINWRPLLIPLGGVALTLLIYVLRTIG